MSHGFKYHHYPDDSQIYISSPHFYPEPQCLNLIVYSISPFGRLRFQTQHEKTKFLISAFKNLFYNTVLPELLTMSLLSHTHLHINKFYQTFYFWNMFRVHFTFYHLNRYHSAPNHYHYWLLQLTSWYHFSLINVFIFIWLPLWNLWETEDLSHLVPRTLGNLADKPQILARTNKYWTPPHMQSFT